MRSKHDRLVQALTGKFDDHHAELARMLLTRSTPCLSDRHAHHPFGELIAAIPAAQSIDAAAAPARTPDAGQVAPVLPAVYRLDEVTGIGREASQAIIS